MIPNVAYYSLERRFSFQTLIPSRRSRIAATSSPFAIAAALRRSPLLFRHPLSPLFLCRSPIVTISLKSTIVTISSKSPVAAALSRVMSRTVLFGVRGIGYEVLNDVWYFSSRRS
ncbi:hypothetical protein L2E82_01458 [Cichorium intybus]|uniref:Uncharacterized protein n=1 Tax=Cichorium intybus TaxID=13427 RepID=A0ACB9GYV7_CICIN|nr:hypothetical protein L2E82_01458 [Cichorium intybus]